jgi:hypothetical protein
MLARCAVRASAFAEFEFAGLEVLLELAPFLFGGLTVFGQGSLGASTVDERPVGTDEFFVEHGHEGLAGVQVGVAEQAGDDVDGKPAGHGFGCEDTTEVVWRVPQRVSSVVDQSSAG